MSPLLWVTFRQFKKHTQKKSREGKGSLLNFLCDVSQRYFLCCLLHSWASRLLFRRHFIRMSALFLCVCVVVGQRRHDGGTVSRNAVHLQKSRRFVHMPRCCPFQCLSPETLTWSGLLRVNYRHVCICVQIAHDVVRWCSGLCGKSWTRAALNLQAPCALERGEQITRHSVQWKGDSLVRHSM